MKIPGSITYYPPKEEKLNIITHAVGLILSILGLFFLFLRSSIFNDKYHMVSFIVFGISMVLLYAASTFYHSAKTDILRQRLNIMDHSAIYVLIAGTYTPYALVTLQGTTGWLIFIIIWTLAIIGIILKLFYTGRYQLLSTFLYVGMGWIIVFAIKPLMNNLSIDGLYWLAAGGIAYTIGAVLFSIEKIPYNHAIFHLFVLLGSLCHFLSIYLYVVPITSTIL